MEECFQTEDETGHILGGGELAELARTHCRVEEEIKVEIMENHEFSRNSII